MGLAFRITSQSTLPAFRSATSALKSPSWSLGSGIAGSVATRNRLAHIAERIVDGQRQRCNRRILIQPRKHSALAGVGLQILRQRGEKLLLLVGPRVSGRVHARRRPPPAPTPPQTPESRSRADPADARPSCRWWWSCSPPRRAGSCRFPAACAGRRSRAPAYGSPDSRARKKIRVERNDHIGLAQVVLNVHAVL